jgi:segregation and condensation protein B
MGHVPSTDDIDEPPAAEDQAAEDTAVQEMPEEEELVELPLENVVEALLFAARMPLTAKQLAKCVGAGTRQDKVREAIASLNQHYSDTGRAFEIVEIAEKFRIMSRPEYAGHIQRLYPKKDQDRRLTPAALDTLSIIAYKQPITRVEIETVRGVGCGPVLRTLVERGLVRVVGKKTDVLGYPWLYGTTDVFLQDFGLAALEELPMVHELRRATGTEGPLPSGNALSPGLPDDDAGDDADDLDAEADEDEEDDMATEEEADEEDA